MRTTPELEPLYRQAAQATAKGSKSFYFATRFFPRDLARAAHAVYWFCRYTDDIVDESVSVDRGRAELDEWEHLVRKHDDGGHPVLRAFFDTAERCNIPEEYPLELIAGMRMDLEGTRYINFDELRVFCYRVASVVGLMMCHVIGYRNPALEYATDLGIGMQLTNILRDVGEDLDRGRIYIPSDELARFGYSEDELRGRIHNEAFRNLMRFQVERARSYYRNADAGIGLLEPGGRFAVKVASDVYQRILNRIEALDYNVFDNRAVVPAVQKYWITARSIMGRGRGY